MEDVKSKPVKTDNLPGLDLPMYQPRFHVDRAQSMEAAFNSAVGATEALAQITSMWEVSDTAEQLNQPKIDAATLNEMYADTGYKFTRPMTEIEANHITEFIREKQEYEEIVQNGPQDKFQRYGLNFGMTALAHVADPIEFGVGVFTYGLTSSVATSLSAGLARTAGSGALARIGQLGSSRLAGMVAGSTGEVLATEPLAIAGEGLQGRDYTTGDFLFNATLGILLGTTFDVGGEYVGNLITGRNRNISELFEQSPELMAEAAAVNATRMEAGFRPDKDLWIKHSQNEIYARPSDQVLKEFGLPEYRYEGPIVGMEKTINKRIFTTTKKPASEFSGSVDSYKYGGDYGPGIYFTDDPYLADNAAFASKENAGSIFEVGVEGELKMIDLDIPLPEPVQRILEHIKKTHFPDLPLFQTTIRGKAFASGKEVLDVLQALDGSDFAPEFRYKDFLDDIKAEGYDGFYHQAQDIGPEGAKRNVGVIFKSDRVKPVAKINGTQMLKTKPTDEALHSMRKEAFDESQRIDYDPAPMEKMNQTLLKEDYTSPSYGNAAKKTSKQIIEAQTKEADGLAATIQDLANQVGDDSVDEVMKRIDQIDKEARLGDEAMDSLINCKLKEM